MKSSNLYKLPKDLLIKIILDREKIKDLQLDEKILFDLVEKVDDEVNKELLCKLGERYKLIIDLCRSCYKKEEEDHMYQCENCQRYVCFYCFDQDIELCLDCFKEAKCDNCGKICEEKYRCARSVFRQFRDDHGIFCSDCCTEYVIQKSDVFSDTLLLHRCPDHLITHCQYCKKKSSSYIECSRCYYKCCDKCMSSSLRCKNCRGY